MKKINAIAWLITMLMTLAASPAFAADWGSENVTMQIGETKTLYLPSSVTSKTLKSLNFYSASISYVEVVSQTSYSVKVRALKATSTPVIVRCDYYYYINYGGYTYQNGGAYDFRIEIAGETKVKPTKITLPKTVSLDVGESKDVVATVTPANAEYTLTWSITDSSIATVYQNGMITGKSVGYADLKVKADNGVSATCRVSVYQPTPTSVTMKSSLSMNVGDTYTLSPSVYPSNSKYTLTWSSSNTSVATVSSSGKVTAKSAGTANITVKTDNGKTATCKVTVSGKTVTSITMRSSLSLEVGSTYTLTPSITPSDAKTSYTWSSSNTSVATVSSSGKVTAKGAGTANIAVKTDNGKSATCKITVYAPQTKEYELRYSVCDGGKVLYGNNTLTGSDTFKVTEGSDVALKIIPDEGYMIDRLWVDYTDAKDQLVGNVLPLRAIKKDISLVVSFEKSENYEVVVPIYLNCDIGEGGYITNGYNTVSGKAKIEMSNGNDITMTIVANKGYHMSSVTIDGKNITSQLSGNALTVKNMSKDRSLVVRFEKDSQPAVNENSVTLGSVTASTGSEVTVPVSLTNKDKITAIQLDLRLPEGVSIATDNYGDAKIVNGSRLGSKHTAECNKMANGMYRVVCYSTKNEVLSGNSGTLFNVTLSVGTNMAEGDYKIVATNIELSDNSGVAYTVKETSGTVSVKKSTLGDTDGNGRYTINDAVCIINNILNQPNSNFVKNAADLDGNGRITINDAVLLISKYIFGEPSKARRGTAATAYDGENQLSIGAVKMQPGEVRTIEVEMINDRDDIKGLQCDISLPSGFSFVYDDDAEDYVSPSNRVPAKLALSSEKQCEETLRVAGVCTGTTAIHGHTGSVFSFKVKADENVMMGMYQILLSNVELSYGEALCVSDQSSALEITGSTSGISTPATDGQELPVIYDLRGQRMDASKAKKGLFIVNGKKVFLK